MWRLLVTLQSFPASTGRFYLVSLISKMLHMQASNLRPQSYEPCALPTTPMCNVVVINRIEPSTSMVSAWRSTVELYHSMSGHTVTIRVLLLKRQEHHLNALAGYVPAFLSKSIILQLHFSVEVAGIEPTCNHLPFQHCIRVRGYTSIIITHPAGVEPASILFSLNRIRHHGTFGC